MSELSPERQAVQIVSTWKAIDEPFRTDALLRYYIMLALKDTSCNRDHCTPEERAVIEAAVANREAETRNESESYGKGFERLLHTQREFRLAVHALLTARAKKGEVG